MDAVISRIYRLGVVTCLAVVVVLVACTGGSESAAPTATQVPTPQQGQADEPRDASPAPTDRRTVGVSATCAGQRDALAALYNATNGDNWRGKDNWLTDHPVNTWLGVTADSDGCVTQLLLERNYLSGEIPPELDNLANLELLDLRWNQLSGEIPPELGSLADLEWLDLSKNRLSREIPPELGDLARLRALYLYGNQLSGCVPSNLQDQLDDADLSGLRSVGDPKHPRLRLCGLKSRSTEKRWPPSTTPRTVQIGETTQTG